MRKPEFCICLIHSHSELLAENFASHTTLSPIGSALALDEISSGLARMSHIIDAVLETGSSRPLVKSA